MFIVVAVVVASTPLEQLVNVSTLMVITLSVVLFDSGFPIVIWAPESS